MTKKTRTVDRAPMQDTILAIGAHADDLELQMGGTLAKYHQGYGYDIIYVMATNNMSGAKHAEFDPADTRPLHVRTSELRKREAEAAANYFGTNAVHLDHPQRHFSLTPGPDGGERVYADYGAPAFEGQDSGIPCILRAHEHPPSIQRVIDLIRKYDPEVIFTHGGPIGNLEHAATQLLVNKAYWAAVGQGYQGMLVGWHDLGWNHFCEYRQRWDTHVDISDYWQQKMDATRLHVTMKPHPEQLDWPEWGPACNCRHAEVFDVIGRIKNTLQQGALTLELIQHMR